MHYLTFTPETSHYPVALLTRYLRKKELEVHVKGFETEAVAFGISVSPKAKKAELDAYVAGLFPTLCRLQVDYLIVTEGALFKHLTKVPKVNDAIGYVLPCRLKDYEHMSVVYMPSPQQLIYNPELFSKLESSRDALVAHRQGRYVEPGTGAAKTMVFPDTVEEIRYWLDKLVDTPLAMDIEAYSLKFHQAGIGTICLCWNQEEGIAFAVDQGPHKEQVRALLKQFFERRRALTLWHNGTYDLTVLIYQLFMRDVLDTEGLLHGLEVMTRNWHDTKIITYLATNSCAGNTLGLKDLAQEYLGSWAQDVTDITVLDPQDLLTYNVHDGLGTWFVYNKYYPRMVQDQQLEVYEKLFLPMARDIIQMQLTGLPLDMDAVLEGEKKMHEIWEQARTRILTSKPVEQANRLLADRWALKRNIELKVKRVTPDDYPEQFNINSSQQLQVLLFEIMGLPVLGRTKTKQPETGGDTLKSLKNHTQDPVHLDVLEALIEYAEVDKILGTFIKAFKEALQGPDGWHYLLGFFNIGGTVSGRLSSNSPNLQNLPSSGTRYAKIIKKMFKAPPGWLFVGLDFASLEDRISALTTKDPNKVRVYTDGFDGHSLRAYSYFKDQMPSVRQANESERCFAVKVGSQIHYCKAGDLLVDSSGSRVRVEEYFDTSQRL